MNEYTMQDHAERLEDMVTSYAKMIRNDASKRQAVLKDLKRQAERVIEAVEKEME